MLSRIAALVSLVGLVQPATLTPAKAADPAPVVVQNCSPNNFRHTLDVTFTNVSQKVVTNVKLGIKTRDAVLMMKDDAGTFAPGDKVSHRLLINQDFLLMPVKLSCDAAQVTFQDGTTWENPTLPPDMVRATRQTPGSKVALSHCYSTPGLRIGFTNTAQQDATEIDLGVVQHGLLVLKDEETGTFSPGTLIERGEYADPRRRKITGELVPSDMLQEYCVVLGIKYADGTSWTNTNVPPESFKGLTFDPPTPGPNDPITITGCDGSSLSADYIGEWRVDYQNASQKPIVAADLGFFMHGRLQSIARDLHNLAPGEGSRPRFQHDDPHYYHGVCVPVSVEFADGTTWLNPAFAPPPN